ncbi:MAG: hypothetical protein ABJM06_09190 [Gilvibacter sp.]
MAKKIPKFNESTSLQQFRGSIDFLQTHIQLIDASLVTSIRKLKAHPEKNDRITKGLNVKDEKYSKLNHPVKQYSSIFRHTQKKNIEFAINKLFAIFTEYMKNVTLEMYKSKPYFIIQKAVVNKKDEDKENLQMTFAEILRLGTAENINNEMVSRVFRSIEELRSTPKLLERILSDTKIMMSKEMKRKALMYLEMRHLFIHAKGIVDNKYAATYGSFFTPELKVKNQLPKKYEIFDDALKNITNLVQHIDKELIRTGFIDVRKFNNK